MVSQGLDSKLFFSVVKDFSFKPLGFYLNHHQVNSFAWISHGEGNTSDERLLVFCKHSYFLEVDLSCSKGTQNSTTFYIENKNCQVYKVNNLLQYRALGDRIEDSDCEEAGEILEDAKKVLKKLKHEKKKEKRELREIELGIPETRKPPEILCYLPSTYPGHIWLSLGKTDYGYLFEFALTKEFKDHPIDLVPVRALEILTIETISVTAMKFSPCGHFIFMGLQDGSVNTCYLEKSFDPSSGYDFAKFQVNDPDFGSVKFIEVSPDGSFIVTAAADGNIFDIHFYTHRKTTRNYGTLPAISPEKIINMDDIMSNKVLSIEDDIQHKLISREKELKNQYLEQLDELKNQYIQFKERYDDYLNKCKLSLKRIEDIPKELLVDYQDISCSPTAAKLYTVENDAIILKMAKESEKEGVKITLLKEKYVAFFKSRIKDEKVCVEDDEIVQSFRTCKIPTCVNNFKATLYTPVYKKKIEKHIALVESEEHLKTRTRNDTLVYLETKLARAMKDVIDYPQETPISGIIRRYNERKQGMIKMLRELISEVKFLDAIVPDEKCYEIAKSEIDALYFKFKDTHGLELIFPELLSAFSERRDNLLLYLKMINKFFNSFNDSVNEASQLKQLTDENILEPISSETSSCLSERTQFMKEKHISVMKSSTCKMTPKLGLKIDWTPCKSKKSKIPLLGKRRTPSPRKDMWSLKKFKSYHTLLRTIKPKIDCEKKFIELRFIMKCIELNSLKGNLFAERNSLKNIEDLEGQLSIEKHEIQIIDEEITTLTNLRLLEKKKWMDLFKELMKFLGRKHKNKGYLKQLFKKKIGAERDIKKQRRHTSSESSDSEQNIDSEDDFESINSEGVSRELIEKVTDFRLKRHEVEMKMKEFKRKIRSTLVKKNAGSRKIKKIEDLLIEAHKDLDSLLIPRKTTWETLKWPLVLYPENVHLDFISTGVGHIENPKRVIEKEMVEINRNVNMDLIVVNNYITASVFLLATRVVSLEINDLVDVVSAFLPVINEVSSSVDNYFENLLMDSKSTEHTGICETFTDESYNIIKKILESVLDPKATEENDVATEEKEETSSSDNKDSLPSELDIPLRDDKIAILMQYKQKTLNLEKRKAYYSWKDVCEDVDLLGQNGITGSHDVFMEDFLSRAISHIDYKSTLDSTQNFIPDYYMLPFTYSVTETEEVNLEEEITVTPEEEIRCVVVEVMENVLRLISEYENPVPQEKESIYEHKYPTYAGGGLMLNLSVLKEMEENSYDGYPFSSFYQEVKLMEDAKPVSKAERLKPDKNVETNAFSDYSLKSVSDFITVNVDAVLKLIQSYNDINVSISELGQQLSALKKKGLISKRPIQNKQDLIDEQQDLENAMKSKFGCVLDLGELLDAIDNPHILIKKHDFKTKMASLRNSLIHLKAEEISAIQSLDALRLEDTKICYELVELRNLFRFFSKIYSSQHSILPKIGKTMKADTDPSGDFEN